MPDVRVRFAPSPTGSLHIGGVRTTLYNYFLARQNNGALVLRIEDTDQDRLVPGAIDSIYDSLRWMGIDWDEGPREGGPFGPYVQSERLALYREHAAALVESGAAYPCFCSEERLEQVRRAQQQRHEITHYDRHCRSIDPREAADRAASGPHVVRLRVPEDGTIAIDDLVFGRVEWELRTLEDQVLMKSDGFPTYHLAAIVDDHAMKISHVLRAEDWLPSTPKHLLVYRAFGWEVPPHAHLPNVLGADGRKLSKRHGATAVAEFKRGGYLPEALTNFLALIGWSSGTEDEIFGVADLVERWRIERVHKAGGRWDEERLRWFNGVWIRRLEPDELVRRLGDFVPAEWDRALLREIVPHIQERMQTLVEAKEQIEFLFVDDLSYDASILVPKKRDRGAVVELLANVTVPLRYLDPFDHERVEHALKAIAEERSWKQGEVNQPLRAAITGRLVGPPLYQSIAVLGKERTLRRLEEAQEKLASERSS